MTEAWIDDLEVGPVIETSGSPSATGGKTPTQGQITSRSSVPPTGVMPVPPPSAAKSTRVAVEFNRDQLYVAGRKWLFRGVRYSDTPLKVLRDAGLNTLFVSDKLDSAVYDEAIREGFWLAPTLPAGTPDPEAIARDVSRFSADDAVLFWYLGADFRGGDIDTITRTAQAVRTADPNRPIALDAWDGLPAYSRRADLLASHRFPLHTSLELAAVPRLAEFPPATRPLRLVLLDLGADALAGLVPRGGVSGGRPQPVQPSRSARSRSRFGC